MIYQYVAYSESGDVVSGKLTAATENAATDLLGYAGYQVVSLKPFVPFFNAERFLSGLFRVKPSETILFYRQLALLLESGINIVTALELLRAQTSNRILKKVIAEVIADLRCGNQLSTALSKHPKVFSPLCCRSLSVGERSGGLEAVLRQMADYTEKEVITSKSIKGALMYPIAISGVTVVVIGVLVVFVLPAFSGLYSSLGAELPRMTELVIAGSTMLRENILYIILVLLILIGAAMIYLKTPEGKYKWHGLALSLPLVGRINHLSELSRCCRSVSLLYHAGLPLTGIMPLIIQSTGNKVMADALTDVQQGMLKGEGLSQPMSRSDIFLPMMVQMVKVGEETGSLDSTLLAVAQSYETEAADRTKSLIGLIQPAMTLIIAVIVGVIALSLVSAMYSVYGQMS